MPSELKDLQGLSSSSSFLGHSTSFPNERQVGFWKPEGTSNSEGRGNSFASSPLEKYLTVEQQMGKPLERPDSYLIQNQNENTNFHTSRAEVEASQPLTLLRPVDQDPVQSTFYFAQGKKNSMLGAQYENSLFSSSLSELFCRKLRLSSNNGFDGHSINTVASHYEEEPLESLEELEAQTIGDLLPKDDDLLSGLTHDLEHIAQPANTDDAEEIDLFNSVGGMDLGDDSSTTQKVSSELPGGIVPEQWMIYKNSIAGEHPYGEHPSRTLFVRNINSNVEDSELKALFEQYGDIRQLYTACKHRGFVMIAYFDIRSARNAMKALQNKPLRRRKLDIHYSIPKDNPSEKDVNQGTLAVFNLDSSVSNEKLYEIFGRYGEIKEIRETPHRSNQKFVEYYDVRAADAALRALNRCEIAGKRIKLEPSRPGGTRRLVQQLASGLDQDGTGHFPQQSSPPYESTTGFSGSLPLLGSISNGMDNGNILGVNSAVRAPVSSLRESGIHHGVSSSVSNGLQSLLRVDSVGNQSGLAESNQSQGHLKLNIASAFHPHSLPEYIDCLTDSSSPGMMSRNINPRQERIDNRQMSGVNGHADLNGSVFGSANGGQSIPGHPITWSNSYNPQPPGMMWQNSPSASFVSGIGSPHPPQQLHGIPRAPSSMLNPVLPVNNHHVGSAPTVNPLWDMQHTYVGESPEASGFHPGSLGSMRMSNNPLHSMEFVSRNIFPNVGANSMEIPHKNIGFQSPQQKFMMYPGRGQMLPMMNSFDPSSERARSRRNEGCSNQADKKHFELDLERIMRGEDNRTTLMIKNIPNKYTSKMLLAAIDDRHKGTYDFIYLPIDFKNKCNVGYAFINMTDPKHIVPFYKTFNGKKWEKFNSEKVASLAYARIQGKAALIAHFQNSSLMNEDKRCRPILFNTEGPNAGDQVPFPMGPNVRSRPGKSRINTNEEFHQDSAASAAKEENFVKGDASSGSVKESD